MKKDAWGINVKDKALVSFIEQEPPKEFKEKFGALCLRGLDMDDAKELIKEIAKFDTQRIVFTQKGYLLFGFRPEVRPVSFAGEDGAELSTQVSMVVQNALESKCILFRDINHLYEEESFPWIKSSAGFNPAWHSYKSGESLSLNNKEVILTEERLDSFCRTFSFDKEEMRMAVMEGIFVAEEIKSAVCSPWDLIAGGYFVSKEIPPADAPHNPEEEKEDLHAFQDEATEKDAPPTEGEPTKKNITDFSDVTELPAKESESSSSSAVPSLSPPIKPLPIKDFLIAWKEGKLDVKDMRDMLADLPEEETDFKKAVRKVLVGKGNETHGKIGKMNSLQYKKFALEYGIN